MGWTDESVEMLRKLWAQGLTANEIAKKLGVTKNAIVGKVHRLCLKARPSPIKTKGIENTEIEAMQPIDILQEDPHEEDIVAEIAVVEEAKKNNKKTGNVKLVDLDSHTCRWPIGDPRDEDFCFCGKKVKSGQTYCDEHAVMAYVKANRK